ncbi:MAG: anthranilate synthase component I [Clostridia bacterium]|nr:anthranilate synthase component I [Clostridia bacterium]
MRNLRTYVREFSGDTETPITIFYKYVGNEKGFLLESRGEGKTNFSIMGKNPMAVLKGDDELEINERGKITVYKGRLLDGVREYVKSFNVIDDNGLPFTGGAVGAMGYDIIRQYEKIPDENKEIINTPTVHLMVFDEFVIYDHLHDRIKIAVLAENSEDAESVLDRMEREIKSSIPAEHYAVKEPKPIKFTSNMTKENYENIVEKAKRYIYDGDIFQVVLSQRLTAKTDDRPIDLYRRLRAINPSPYLFFFNFEDYYVAGSSPEMLVEVKGDTVRTCPIAGTRKRGKNPKEDIEIAEGLLEDPKEKAEHTMLVDLARNDMGRIAKIGSVKIKEFMQVHYYSHVMHLVTMVEGEKREDADSFDVLSTFLPAGTLSGAPKIRAMEIIEELENERRGLYGGAVGYFDFNGNMDTCIAIRTMIIKDGNVYMQAGAGIVADSIPEMEYEESHNKVRALVKTIGGEV